MYLARIEYVAHTFKNGGQTRYPPVAPTAPSLWRNSFTGYHVTHSKIDARAETT